MLENEKWYGGFVAKGSQMPYVQTSGLLDLAKQNFNNQGVPLLLSNKGRYIWSDEAFKFEVKTNNISIESKYETVAVTEAGKTLREAYLEACRKHFPPSGQLPDTMMFSMPQYNTWIELMYNQNQKDILKYADDILSNGFPAGVLMIDDNWQKYYGNFDFKPDRFPEPETMVKRLHDQGFKVMLWVCPFVSADSPEFRELWSKGYLINNRKTGQPAMINWWNGYSACYDLTNPAAFDYFVNLLKDVQRKYGVDGFKFDAGDVLFYDPDYTLGYKSDAASTDHTMAWAKVGLHFPLNEYRACWKMGGEALVQRLGDKDYSWKAVRLLIPDMIAAGLLGYAYTCPDMIGGGQFTSFLGIDPSQFNQELIVRSAQSHTLMPMMQFSVAPWRILDSLHLAICREMANLHVRMGAYITECAKHAAITGEPIVRHMEYVFPNQGFAECKDQFMLGDKFLVAPVIKSGTERKVILPKGKWRDESGKIYKGGQSINIEAKLSRLPYFTMVIQ
jgi:alpha-glucosidase